MSSQTMRVTEQPDIWDADTVPASPAADRRAAAAPEPEEGLAHKAARLFAGMFDEKVEGPRQIVEDAHEAAREAPKMKGAEAKQAVKGLAHMSTQELAEVSGQIRRYAKNLGTASELTKHLGESMHGASELLESIAGGLEGAGLAGQVGAATAEWSQAFDVFMKSKSQHNGQQLSEATDAWCGVVGELTGYAPEPVKSSLSLLLTGARTAIRTVTSATVNHEGHVHATVEANDHEPAPEAARAENPYAVEMQRDKERGERMGGDLAHLASYRAKFEQGVQDCPHMLNPAAIRACREAMDEWQPLEDELAEAQSGLLGSFRHRGRIADTQARLEVVKDKLRGLIRAAGLESSVPLPK